MDQETGRFLDTGQKIYCDRPWKRAHVFADGDITPCEFDMQREFRLGNLAQVTDLGECWTNDVARRFRRMFLNDIRQISFCRFCPYKDQVVWDPTVEYHHLSEVAAGR